MSRELTQGFFAMTVAVFLQLCKRSNVKNHRALYKVRGGFYGRIEA